MSQTKLCSTSSTPDVVTFMNQPLERDALRGLVRSPMTGVGHAHMIMRIGYWDPVPATLRRPLSAVRRDRGSPT